MLIAIEPAREVGAEAQVLVERGEVHGLRAGRLPSSTEGAGVDASDRGAAMRFGLRSLWDDLAIGEQHAFRERR